MDVQLIKNFIDYGGMFVIALVFIWWILKVDIPKRERRFEKQTQQLLDAFKGEREEMLTAFREDRSQILSKLEKINSSLIVSSRTCAVNRSMGLVQYLMDKDSNLTFDQASTKVREFWKINGVDLTEDRRQE